MERIFYIASITCLTIGAVLYGIVAILHFIN